MCTSVSVFTSTVVVRTTINPFFWRDFLFLAAKKLDGGGAVFDAPQAHAFRRGRDPEGLVLVRGPLPQQGGEVAAASVRHGVLEVARGRLQRPGPYVQGGC